MLLALTIDHPGNIQMLQLEQAGLVPVPEAFRLPNSYLRAVLVKVLDGRIRHVEILTRPVFYGLDDGWGG